MAAISAVAQFYLSLLLLMFVFSKSILYMICELYLNYHNIFFVHHRVLHHRLHRQVDVLQMLLIRSCPECQPVFHGWYFPASSSTVYCQHVDSYLRHLPTTCFCCFVLTFCLTRNVTRCCKRKHMQRHLRILIISLHANCNISMQVL